MSPATGGLGGFATLGLRSWRDVLNLNSATFGVLLGLDISGLLGFRIDIALLGGEAAEGWGLGGLLRGLAHRVTASKDGIVTNVLRRDGRVLDLTGCRGG